MQGFFALFVVLTGGYLLLASLLFFLQDRLLYLPHKTLITTPAEHHLAYEDVTIVAADGVRLHGWFIPGNTQEVLLFFHGNAGNISHRIESIAIFHELGLSVLIVDYRGYGLSDGRPDYAGLNLDAHAAWDYLVLKRGIAADRVVIFGRSLGAAVAAKLATQVQPKAVILESAFTSVADLASEIYPWLPVRTLLRHPHESAAYLEQIDAPLLLIHSREDEIVPFAHHQRLKTIAPHAHTLTLRGGHNDGFWVSRPHYLQELRGFLAAR